MSNEKDIFIPDGWIKTTLESQCSIKTGKKDANEGSVDGKYPFFTCSRSHIYSELYSFDTEAILIAGNGDVGNLHYYNGKFEAYQRTYVLDAFKGNVFYIYQYLDLWLVQSLMREKIGTSIPYIKLNHLSDFDILLPKTIKEQEKIVEILTTVDKTIEKTDDLIEKYKKIKTGLMEDLFTKGIDVDTGKSHTKLKDSELGRIPESWEVLKISQLMKVVGGYAFKSKDESSHGIPWLKIANVGVGKVKRDIKSYLPYKFKEIHNNFLLNEGDIVVALTRPLLSKKLKIARISNEDGISLLNQRVGKFNCSNIDKGYAYYLFCLYSTINAIDIEILGTDPPNISTEQIGEIKVIVPKDIKEQEKITEVIVEADNNIEKEEVYKKKLVKMKKGLMNDLLTGRVRVEF